MFSDFKITKDILLANQHFFISGVRVSGVLLYTKIKYF